MDFNKALFRIIKILFTIMIVLLVIYGAVRLCRMGYDYGYRLYTEPAMSEEPGEDVLVQIKDGMSNREIGVLLEEKGLIRDSLLFYVQLTFSSYKDGIKPGIYTLNTSMKPDELMAAMCPLEEEVLEEQTDTEEVETNSEEVE